MIAVRLSIVRLITMSLPRFTFKEWLLEHKEKFLTFTIREIADIALMSGYSQEEIERWMTGKKKYYI